MSTPFILQLPCRPFCIFVPPLPGQTKECLWTSFVPHGGPAAPGQPASGPHDCGGAAGANEAPPEGAGPRAQETPQPRRPFLHKPFLLHRPSPSLLFHHQAALQLRRACLLRTLHPTCPQPQKQGAPAAPPVLLCPAAAPSNIIRTANILAVCHV